MKHLFRILTAFALSLLLLDSCTKDILPAIPSGDDITIVQKDTVSLLPYWHKVATFPSIIITTDGSQSVSSKTRYVSATASFNDPDCMYSEVQSVSGILRIRGRGNTTWNCEKKPYRLKLDTKSKIFGMKADRDWVLLAEFALTRIDLYFMETDVPSSTKW